MTDYLATLRAAGWSVAVHNDYRLHGESHTFWLFTHPNGRWVKGEGRTDEEATEAAWKMAQSLELPDILNRVFLRTHSNAVQDVFAERQRQAAKGYDAAHDDGHTDGEIGEAAVAYLLMAQGDSADAEPHWPWTKPMPHWSEGRRKLIVQALACGIAELERLDRVGLLANALAQSAASGGGDLTTGDTSS